jgi:hypothetical protein
MPSAFRPVENQAATGEVKAVRIDCGQSVLGRRPYDQFAMNKQRRFAFVIGDRRRLALRVKLIEEDPGAQGMSASPRLHAT